MSNLPSTTGNAVQAMQKALQTQTVQASDIPFLRLIKSGEWIYGADDIDVEEGSKWAVNVASFGMGFQAWNKISELVGEEIAPLDAPPILRSDLEDVGAEWKQLLTAQFLCTSGEDKGISVLYKTTAKGGIKAVNALMADIIAHYNADPSAAAQVPVIEFTMDSYKHKQYGKIYTPILKVVDWLEDTAEAAQAVSEPVAKVVEPELEPEPLPIPTRRRRRSA